MTDNEAMARLGQAVGTFPRRAPLLACLADLPEEAWQWLASAAATGIWPEVGGFQEPSQDAIAEARAAADEYLDNDRTAF